jgi:hypothetical protein
VGAASGEQMHSIFVVTVGAQCEAAFVSKSEAERYREEQTTRDSKERRVQVVQCELHISSVAHSDDARPTRCKW